MKKFNNFLFTIATIANGMTVSSLWITHSEYWKISLPIYLICLTLKETFKE